MDVHKDYLTKQIKSCIQLFYCTNFSLIAWVKIVIIITIVIVDSNYYYNLLTLLLLLFIRIITMFARIFMFVLFRLYMYDMDNVYICIVLTKWSNKNKFFFYYKVYT